MNKIKAIVFDMDGVLIDARDWHYEALNQALADVGMEIDRQDHLAHYDGLPTKDKLALLSRHCGLDEALHPWINKQKQKYTMEIAARLCCPNVQHKQALKSLLNSGYKIAVASNSIKETVADFLTRADLLKYLEFYLSNEDVSSAKPAPDIYLKAMARLQIKPEETLVVEDNVNGIQAARSAGAHVLVVNSVNDVNLDNIHRFINTI